jgi:hypothetical protein
MVRHLRIVESDACGSSVECRRRIACGAQVRCAIFEEVGCGAMLEGEAGRGMRNSQSCVTWNHD